MQKLRTLRTSGHLPMGGPGSPAWSECSDGHGAGGGAQQFRDDITGAALPPELVAAARSEEI
eukprot:11318080-Alexandrium_andersonii.AAC.1